MLRVLFTTLAFIGATFQIFMTKTLPEEAFLFNFIIFNIGLWGIAEFIKDYFSFGKRETNLGRQPRSLLHTVAVFFNLFRGILGILCIWFRGDFWSATVIISSLFIFSYGCHEFRHVKEIVTNENRPTYYSDFIVSFDLLFPPALITLLVVYKQGM